MRKDILLLLLVVLMLSGCSNPTFVELQGESESWEGKYSANIGTTSEDATYILNFKKGDEDTIFKNLQIEIDDGILSIKDPNYKGSTVEIPSSCRNCHSSIKESIKVTIKWDDEKEETLYLKQMD